MFERKSMEQIVSKMITWTRGVTTRITDFRVGSKVRTIYEAVAIVVEELYDKVYRFMKNTIEENIYAVIGFNKLPATYASGEVRFSRSTPAEENYFIPAGTVVLSKATQYKAPIKFITTEDALLQVGYTYVDVPVVATVAGKEGNVGAREIDDFLQKPNGIEAVTNLSAIQGGKPEETKEEQKARFQSFIQSNARGDIQAIEYGAKLAQITNEDGLVLERVVQTVAIEDLPARKGEVDLYIWNGVETASEKLKEAVQRILKGYYDENGNPVYGYKPAGTIVNIYSAPIKWVTLKLDLTPEDWALEEDLRIEAEKVIDIFFGAMRLGQTLIQTALETEIKLIEGVKDVKLYVSTDNGTNYSMDNVTVHPYEIIVPKKPLVFK